MCEYFNSIVTCHRKRRFALRSFLRALSLSSILHDKKSFEIVITDGNDDTVHLVDRYRDALNIKHCIVKYDGPFKRGKMLNHAVLNANGKYITVLDIEDIITKHFLSGVEEFYSNAEMENMKLVHRVRPLDYKTSLEFYFTPFEYNLIEWVVQHTDQFKRHVIERYTENEIAFKGENINSDLLNGKALGNSRFTVLKSTFMKIGGYDEKFVGYGCEDMDINLRLYKFLGGGGYVRSDLKHIIYVLMNTTTHTDYFNANMVNKNLIHFKDNKKNNRVILPIDSNWGEF